MGSRQKRQYPDLSKPKRQWTLTVELPEVGMRLDRFLAKRIPWFSRNVLQTRIDRGEVSVNGRVRKASTKLGERDAVVITVNPPDDLPDPAAIPVEVLLDDGALLVVNKQPGIVVHPVGPHQLDNLLSALHARYRNADPALDRVPHVCHRIDRDTSGVYLVAFDEKLKANVSLQFEARTVVKEYLALVFGVPSPAEGEIDAPLKLREYGRSRVYVDPSGNPSRTSYRVEETFADSALVRCFPRTGRTHQIRVHSAHVGHTLLCDEPYGGGEQLLPEGGGPPLLTRCALHSASIEIDHPVTGERTRFEAPLRGDMQGAVEALRAGLRVGEAPGVTRE